MALKNCPECGNQISNKATKCPHCGAPLKTDSTGGCCGCGCLLMIILFFLPVLFPRTDFDEKNTTTRQKSVTNQAVKKEKTVKIGETVNVGYWSYCVWSKEWTNKTSNNEFLNQSPDYQFLKINITVRNNAKDASNLPPIKLVDNNGNEYDTSSKSFGLENGLSLIERVNPSLQKGGFILFDVPTNKQYKLKVSGGYWSSESAYIELN